MRKPYSPNIDYYKTVYNDQIGNGLPVFVGGGMKGNGLGNVLSGLFRTAIPLLKRGGKALLKEGLRTGLNVANDVIEGQNIKSAIKSRSKNAGKRLLTNAIGEFQTSAPPGEPAIKRRRQTKRTKQHKDIFN